MGEELAGEHSSVLNSTVGRLIRSRNVPTLRSRIRSELQGALRRPITLPLPLVRRSVVIHVRLAAATQRFKITTLSPAFIPRRERRVNPALINTVHYFTRTQNDRLVLKISFVRMYIDD